MNRAIYNSRNPEMLLPFSRVRWAGCLLLLIARFAFASDWRVAEEQLAQKITAITGPGVVSLEVNNRSSLSSAEVEEIRGGLVSSLATSGVRVWQPDQAAANIKVTLSENLQNYVWVAEIRQSTNDRNIVLLSLPRPESAMNPQNAFPLTIRAEPLILQRDPILDVAVLETSPRKIIVLSPPAITVQEFQNGRWVIVQSLTISAPKPLPRDSRGRIVLRKDHLFDTYLPGLVCRSSGSAPLNMSCSPSDDPWPLQTENLGVYGVVAFFAPARNFFTGALVPGVGKQKSAPPFYSAAWVPRSNYALWIFSGVDGQLHLLDGINEQIVGRIRWGSDIAGLHAACRQDWQVLADSAATSADNETGDSMQAFEFPDREPLAVSQKLIFNGTVTALWTTARGDSAIAVYRNSETGNYEALQLNLDCNR